MQKRRHLENFHQTDPCCSTDAQSQAFLLSGPALPGEDFRIRMHLNLGQIVFFSKQRIKRITVMYYYY